MRQKYWCVTFLRSYNRKIVTITTMYYTRNSREKVSAVLTSANFASKFFHLGISSVKSSSYIEINSQRENEYVLLNFSNINMYIPMDFTSISSSSIALFHRLTQILFKSEAEASSYRFSVINSLFMKFFKECIGSVARK